MKKYLITYSVQPDWANENERLIGRFLGELNSVRPPELAYRAGRLNGGADSFHLVETAHGPASFSHLPSYRFRAELAAEKMIGGPIMTEFTDLGAPYRSE